MEIIRTEKLRKVYKVLRRQEGFRVFRNLVYREWDEKLALDDIDISVQEGEIVGYIGPNGAGKSTTIKILTGILFPTAGRVRWRVSSRPGTRAERPHHHPGLGAAHLPRLGPARAGLPAP